MITINEHDVHQLQLIDAETDQARIARAEWQRAIDDDLRMLRDYVCEQQFIVWKPGERRQGHNQAQEVHLSTIDTCTCQRFKLRGTCQHTAFVKRLAAAGTLPDTETPVRAGDQMESEKAA